MDLPPNLIPTFQALTTSAVANTVTTGTMVGAPGAGFRLRLWAFQAALRSTAQAAANWRAIVNDTPGLFAYLSATGASFASPPLMFLPGGVALAANTALSWTISSALASLLLNVTTYHTVEAVG